ncbi:MAG: type IV pilus biogenesis/stability protein PilW [Legionellales bacterium]|nr:type IV pilus biogenesis/stability protein PilW [Legionellales bacterium]
MSALETWCGYVVKARHVLSMFCFVFLLSCQSHGPAKAELANHPTKLSEASAYNAQLGLAYLEQGDRPRAKRKLLLALSQAPDSPSAHAAMAYFLEKCGEMDNAHMYYKKAVTLGKSSGAQWNNYGAFLCRQAQYKQAEEYFLLAVKDSNYEHTAGAYENAGLCAMAIPDMAKASLYFQKALVQDPSKEQSLYELVKIELKQDHASQALAYLQKYPDLTLKNPTILALAIDVAHKASKNELEAEYQSHASLGAVSEKTGEKNDHNNNG